MWTLNIYSKVKKVLSKCPGCMQKHKIQKDVRVEHCFFPREKGRVSQIIHMDLAGPMPTTTTGYKYILGIADNFSGYVMGIASRSKA